MHPRRLLRQGGHRHRVALAALNLGGVLACLDRAPLRGSPMARVLVVDDDRDTVDTVVEALREAGYDAIGVVGWRGVPLALHRHQPQVVLLDLLMPEFTGIDLMRMIRHHSDHRLKGIPIVVVTGAGKRVEAWCREHGATDVLQKPCELERVLQAVERATRKG